jgi:hypothetical protein
VANKPDPATRAARLRERLAKRQARQPEPATEPAEAGQPRPGESPNAYVERRMRETLKKGKTKEVP